MSDETTPNAAPPEGSEPPLTPFMMLCGTLATQVQYALGLIQTPDQKESILELGAARQGIDMLGTLEEKTKGNLEEEEQKLLGSMLSQLRFVYVEIAKRAKEQAAGDPTGTVGDGETQSDTDTGASDPGDVAGD